MIHPQFNDSSPAQTSDGSSVITTKIVEIEPLVYFKPLTAFIGLFMGELLAKTWLFLADSGKIPRRSKSFARVVGRVVRSRPLKFLSDGLILVK